MRRKTIRGTTQIAAKAATLSALMQRVHSAFHRKLPGRIWVSIIRTGFHQSPLSLPKRYCLLCLSGGESNSDSPTTVLLLVFFLIFLSLRQQALVICAKIQSKNPCCGVRSSFRRATFRKDKEKHAGNTHWYFQGVFRCISGK